jgi:hypothetical protein
MAAIGKSGRVRLSEANSCPMRYHAVSNHPKEDPVNKAELIEIVAK